MLKKLLSALAVLAVVVIGWFAWKMMQPPPDDLDLRTEKPSDKGLYQASFTPVEGEPAVGPIAVWNLALTDESGKPVTGATVLVDGGMPQHGHGLPTVPASIGETEPGVYAIDGMKFSMRGWWEFRLTIEGDAGKDTVTFNTVLE